MSFLILFLVKTMKIKFEDTDVSERYFDNRFARDAVVIVYDEPMGVSGDAFSTDSCVLDSRTY